MPFIISLCLVPTDNDPTSNVLRSNHAELQTCSSHSISFRRLAAGLSRQVERTKRAASYENVSPADLKERVYEIYRHLGVWLVDKKESDIEQRYIAIGERRLEQNVPLSELVWVIILTKNNLREFINDVSSPGRAADASEKEELLQLLEKFFDHAIHAAVVGYERAAKANAQPGKVMRKAS